MDDAVIVSEGQLGAAVDRGAGELLEHHGHGPLEECDVALYNHIRDVHVQLLAAVRQPVAHGLKVFNTLDPLDTVLKDDIVVIIGKDVRPIRFPLSVIGLAPKFSDCVRRESFGHCNHPSQMVGTLMFY